MVMVGGVVFVHQDLDVGADQFAGLVAEDFLGGRVQGLDGAGLVDGDDAVGDRVHDLAQVFFARRLGLEGAVPLGHVAGHDDVGGAVAVVLVLLIGQGRQFDIQGRAVGAQQDHGCAQALLGQVLDPAREMGQAVGLHEIGKDAALQFDRRPHAQHVGAGRVDQVDGAASAHGDQVRRQFDDVAKTLFRAFHVLEALAVQQVVDEVQHAPAFGRDHLDIFAVMRVRQRAQDFLVHHVGESDDGVQGRAQVVTEGFQKGLVGLFRGVTFALKAPAHLPGAGFDFVDVRH